MKTVRIILSVVLALMLLSALGALLQSRDCTEPAGREKKRKRYEKTEISAGQSLRRSLPKTNEYEKI